MQSCLVSSFQQLDVLGIIVLFFKLGSRTTLSVWSLVSRRSMTVSVNLSRTWSSKRQTTERSTRRWTASSQISCSFARSETSTWCKPRLLSVRCCFHCRHPQQHLWVLPVFQMVDAEGNEAEEDQWMAGHKERCWWVSVPAQCLSVMEALIRHSSSVLMLDFCVQLLLPGGRWQLTSPWWVYLVCRGHQTLSGRGNVEREMWWNLSHQGEPIAEGLLRLFCCVSLISSIFWYPDHSEPAEQLTLKLS